MTEGNKDAIRTAGSAVVGAGVGATVYSLIGGVGVAAAGGAIGITLGPFIAIGAGLGAASYGVFWLGKQVGSKIPPSDDSPSSETTPTSPLPQS